MAEYIKGTVRQMTSEGSHLEWQPVRPFSGNEIRYSSLLEMDVTLDTSRFHISLPVQGMEHYLVDGKHHAAQEGEYFIFNPQQQVRAEGISKTRVDGICIFLTAATLAEAANAAEQPFGAALEPISSQHSFEFLVKTYGLRENSFGQYLQGIRHLLLSKNRDQVIDWDAFYLELATEFLRSNRQIRQQLQNIPAARHLTKQEIYRRLSMAHCYILEQFAEPISLEELEKVALFSKYHLLRLYSQIYGMTPHQHILQLRIERAKELLRQDYSPTEVALMLSFSDRRAFAKLFRKVVGVSPMGFGG